MLDNIKDKIMNDPSERAKVQEEINAQAKELGIREFHALKGQSEFQQLADLKENAGKFTEDMARANEIQTTEQHRKARVASEARMRETSPEIYFKRKEAMEKAAYEARAIRL